MNEIIVLGNLYDPTNVNSSNGRVYDGGGIAPTLGASHFGQEKYIMEKIIVASRGRNPENPSDRMRGIDLEQRLEPNQEGICNTITSVQKDNMVLEKETVKIKQATKEGFIECEVGGVFTPTFPDSKTRRGRVIDGGNTCPTLQTEGDVVRIEKVGQISNDGSQYGTVVSENGLAPTLTAGTHGNANSHIQTKYRIRKLTPLECFRLMDFDDDDFYAAAEVNSNTQLYKQAGNSIVVAVLEHIFRQML